MQELPEVGKTRLAEYKAIRPLIPHDLALTQQYQDRTETYESAMTTPSDERQTFARTRNQHQYYMLKLSNDWMIDTVNTLGLSYKFGTSFDHRRHADLDDSRSAESTGRRHKR